jgi:hypothetical protein
MGTSEPENKKSKLMRTEKSEQENLSKVNEIQEKLSELDEEIRQEIKKVEKRINLKREPLLKKRSELLSKVNNFWAEIFANHDFLSNFVSDEDIEVLKYCTNIETNLEEPSNEETIESVNFYFSENPYFNDKVLWKKIKSKKRSDETYQSEISWKEGKSLTQIPSKNKDESGESKKRSVDDVDDKSSFFNFFEKESDIDEDIISVFIDEIDPNPLSIYLGDVDNAPGDSFIEEENN